MDREYRVQKALFSAGFPVPRPLLHCTDAEVIGTEFYLMEHVKVSWCYEGQYEVSVVQSNIYILLFCLTFTLCSNDKR